MGASLDWSREAYTLDEERNLAVRVAFKTMYDLDLIYRRERVVNWDPKGQTVISDDEIVYVERTAKLYTFRYDKDFPIAISTTRPETKLGDTAVAVHPEDARYQQYVGQEFDAIFCGVPLKIKIIADKSVDKDFGTGALGVTPAHSMIDWELAMRHDLPLVQVIDERARMTTGNENILGKKTTEAREIIIEQLRTQDLIEKEEDITQNVSTAERTGGIIEPLPKLQWFMAVDKAFILKHSEIEGIESGSTTTLKQIMRRAVKSGQVKIVPERFEKIYFHWIDNLRDWCISRQLWFGHRIPVWYCKENKSEQCKEPFASIGSPVFCSHCNSEMEHDPDTFDTWFSAGLWPFSTLGWPKKTVDLQQFYPNSLMNPGYEILFLWVARMILMSGCLLGQIPFKTVSIHGIVRDKDGQKFSKSRGNGVDPLVLANTYGADALRMGLIAGAAPGNDVKFDESRVRGYRNFSTKIWNIARFALANKTADYANDTQINAEKNLSEQDKKYIAEFEQVKSEVAEHIEKLDIHLAAEKAYHYVWHTFADKIIEEYKPLLKENGDRKYAAYHTLETILVGSLKMLHPFMPFVTESIWQIMYPGKFLIIEKW